jgi:predicted DNA binding CopG/RHH family protein
VRVIGERGKKFMKKHKKNYTNESIGNIKVIEDFLPPPHELVLKEETVKVTISLTKESLEFFKKEAKAHHTQYQKMIRALLDQYTNYFQ